MDSEQESRTFLDNALYELSEDDRRTELVRRALEAEERAKKHRRPFRADGVEDNPYGF